jgi:crotonobetainyl-CoA:carnitine CoA-transferase CaiB-like acyl-CoA transferase
MSDQPKILDGIRVIEAANMVYMPCVAAVMADYGAEVIKVEPPGMGDIHRYGHELPGMPDSEIPYPFQVDNRNKKSIALDLRRETGQRTMHRLIETADVFITNYRLQGLEKMKLRWEDLESINPRLIYAYGSGYGERGPESHKPGYDMVCYWSRSGIEGQMFPMEDFLGPIPYGAGDHPAGMMLLVGVMMALYERNRTGRGTKVSSSLVACGVYANSTMISGALCNAEFYEKTRREDAYNFTYIYYMPKDERVFKLNIHDHEKLWPPFCEAIHRPDIIDDPRFAEIPERVKNMKELIAVIDSEIAKQDSTHWFERFESHDIPFTPLPDYEEIAADPQLAANDIFVEVDHPRHGKFRTVNSPFEIAGHEKATPGPSPELGEHTREVLEALELADGEIDELLGDGTAVQRES